jgi:hypothetical protein
MSIDHIRLINRCLGAALIALYLVLGLTFMPDLLPTSTIAIILNGSGER